MPDDLQQLRANIDAFPKAITARLRSVAFRKSREVQARAKQLVPKATGKTRDSIVVIDESEKQQFLVTVENPDEPMLGAWLEYGTVKMRARPFMRPAGDSVVASYRSEMIAVATRTATELLT